LKKQNKRISKNSKHREQKIKSLLLIIIIGVTIYVLNLTINLVIKPVDKVLIEEGKIYLEETTVGYILRDEEVVSRRKL